MRPESANGLAAFPRREKSYAPSEAGASPARRAPAIIAVRATPREESDVDLLVIVEKSDERATRRMQRAHRYRQGLAFAKNVLVPTRTEMDRYKHLRASLFHQVLSRGRRLYG